MGVRGLGFEVGWIAVRRRLSNIVHMRQAAACREAPKIGPHKPRMIANLAARLGCEPQRVNLKGKTHEQVDAIGEGRAVEVHAVVLLERG